MGNQAKAAHKKDQTQHKASTGALQRFFSYFGPSERLSDQRCGGVAPDKGAQDHKRNIGLIDEHNRAHEHRVDDIRRAGHFFRFFGPERRAAQPIKKGLDRAEAKPCLFKSRKCNRGKQSERGRKEFGSQPHGKPRILGCVARNIEDQTRKDDSSENV